MKKYHINVFFSDEDDCWIADIPDLKSCTAFGNAPEEAMREVLVAQQGWIETAIAHGIPIPEPQYVADINSQSDIHTLTTVLPTISALVPVSDLMRSALPDNPCVYFFFRNQHLIYIGESVSLRKRIQQHLSHNLDLSHSAFRRNVAEYLDIENSTITKIHGHKISPQHSDQIGNWIDQLSICWILCKSKQTASLLEQKLRRRFRPLLNKK